MSNRFVAINQDNGQPSNDKRSKRERYGKVPDVSSGGERPSDARRVVGGSNSPKKKVGGGKFGGAKGSHHIEKSLANGRAEALAIVDAARDKAEELIEEAAVATVAREAATVAGRIDPASSLAVPDPGSAVPRVPVVDPPSPVPAPAAGDGLPHDGRSSPSPRPRHPPHAGPSSVGPAKPDGEPVVDGYVALRSTFPVLDSSRLFGVRLGVDKGYLLFLVLLLLSGSIYIYMKTPTEKTVCTPSFFRGYGFNATFDAGLFIPYISPTALYQCLPTVDSFLGVVVEPFASEGCGIDWQRVYLTEPTYLAWNSEGLASWYERWHDKWYDYTHLGNTGNPGLMTLFCWFLFVYVARRFYIRVWWYRILYAILWCNVILWFLTPSYRYCNTYRSHWALYFWLASWVLFCFALAAFPPHWYWLHRSKKTPIPMLAWRPIVIDYVKVLKLFNKHGDELVDRVQDLRADSIRLRDVEHAAAYAKVRHVTNKYSPLHSLLKWLHLAKDLEYTVCLELFSQIATSLKINPADPP